ncbi:MAG: peptidase [Bacteroidetes bacterium]|jgi:Zn-dependent protease|nr:peptidase [Bacteroidota bacterium]
MDDYNGAHRFEHTVGGYPPKPILIEQKKNTIMRSMVSLLIYALLFYFLFDENIAYIAAILVVIIIHEMGHFAFMKIFKYSNVKIFIVPLLGAFTSGKKQEVSQWQLCLIILGGPVPGIIIGSILYYINLDLHNETIKMLANSFLIINLLNCLPFYPLDGGRLIETLFFKQNHIIRLVFGIISILALVGLFLFAKSFIMLVVPILIAMELYNETKHHKIRDYLKHEHINYQVDYKSLPDKDYWLIRDCLLFSFPKKYGGVQPGVYEISVAEPLLIQHINAVLQMKLNFDLNLFQRILVLLFYIAAIVSPFIFFTLSL